MRTVNAQRLGMRNDGKTDLFPERRPHVPDLPSTGFPRNDVLNCLLRGPGSYAPWEPPLDLVETRREIIVFVALPGVDPDKVEVEARNGALVLRGEGSRSHVPEGARVRRMELPSGPFARSVSIPEGEYQVTRQTIRGCVLLRLVRSDVQGDHTA